MLVRIAYNWSSGPGWTEMRKRVARHMLLEMDVFEIGEALGMTPHNAQRYVHDVAKLTGARTQRDAVTSMLNSEELLGIVYGIRKVKQ
jgi:hypothetical protein